MQHLSRALILLATVACGSDGAGDDPLDMPTDGEPDGDPGSIPPPWLPTDTCTVGAAAGALTVATDRGLVKGAATEGATRFLGVPFAQPPVGDLRFKPPVAGACWEGVKEATAYAPQCAQRDSVTGNVVGSEDCLYLNVWTPSAALTDGKPRPVLFWIYGGGNIVGSTNTPNLTGGGGNQYDGQHLAEERDVVVVSVSYRVASLGFLALPSLTAESPFHSSGGYGVLDQIAGLSWVQRNIARFGGDPAHVMLFGESAGGINICTLAASPLAKGLFSSAVMQSGFCVAMPLAEREALGAKVLATAGCEGAEDELACLRAAPPEKLTEPFFAGAAAGDSPLDSQRALPTANIDGWILKDHPLTAIEAGAHNHVPFIVGSNTNENSVFLASTVVATCGAFEDQIAAAFPDDKDQLLGLYPCSALNPKQALIDVHTDSTFTCGARRAARALDAGQDEAVHRYLFDYSPPGNPMGAYHTAEIPYVFGTYKAALSLPNADADLVSGALQGYWTRLAGTGDPNGTGALSWSLYGTVQDNALLIDDDMGSVADIAKARCDFWDTITPR